MIYTKVDGLEGSHGMDLFLRGLAVRLGLGKSIYTLVCIYVCVVAYMYRVCTCRLSHSFVLAVHFGLGIMGISIKNSNESINWRLKGLTIGLGLNVASSVLTVSKIK